MATIMMIVAGMADAGGVAVVLAGGEKGWGYYALMMLVIWLAVAACGTTRR